MSDLISRSELIKLFKEHMRTAKDFREIIVNIIPTIKNQPTAYDIDKVIAELEKIRAKKTCNKEKCDTKEICRICVVDDAIEIVKHGCASDDVCEWEKGSSGYVGYPAFYSKCCTTNGKGLEMQTNIIADWKYCPYCGKKIKVVE